MITDIARPELRRNGLDQRWRLIWIVFQRISSQ